MLKNSRVLVLGGSGMLGHKVFQVLDKRFETYATFRNGSSISNMFGRVEATDFNSIIRTFAQVRPHVVINCIGIIKQLNRDPVINIEINSLFPHRLADLCEATATRMFHISTDCVFSGRKGNYTEDDTPDAKDIYGRTKALGEVERANCLTIRTSIFGRDSTKTVGLLEWFLSQRRVNGYKNAIYSGFPTQVFARIMGDIIEHYPDLSGLYNIASQPISKCELLTRIRDIMNLDIEIIPYDDPPCDRSLNPTRFIEATDYHIPSWDEMIAELGDTDHA